MGLIKNMFAKWGASEVLVTDNSKTQTGKNGREQVEW